MKNCILVALASVIFAACGGANTSSIDPSQKAQTEVLPSIKQTASSYQTAVESLYVAYFGRPADPNGLANFEAALQAAGAPADVPGLALSYGSNAAVKSLIDSFGTSAESQTLYGSGDTSAFVKAVFQNVLGRAPQSSGLAFWVNSIDSGQTSSGDAALAIMAGAFNNTTAQGLLDQQLINNRLAAAGDFTGAATASTYTGATAAADARTMLATITASTSASALQSTAVTSAQAINNQTVFESTALHGGEWYIYENMPYGGGVLTSGTNYVYGQVTNILQQSPISGAQQTTTTFQSLDSALRAPNTSVSRYLVNGQVLVRPVAGLRAISYVGSGVQVQYYDATEQSVATTAVFDNYAAASLSGQMSTASEEVQAALPINQWIAANNFAANAAWQSGSGYIKHQGHAVGDEYLIEDCTNVTSPTYTYGNNPTPCVENASLSSIFPISLLYSNGRPYEVDNVGDGTISTVQGMPIWISNNPLSTALEGGVTYRIYLQMNGNVYLGLLTKDGTPFLYQQPDGTYVNYKIGFNQAAASSVGQGLISGATVGSKTGSGAAVSDTIDMFGIGGTGVNGALSPADLRAHYNVPGTLTGAEQTVAIVDAPTTADVEADLAAYSSYYNLPACSTTNGCLIELTFAPTAGSKDNWGIEPDLDVEMVHAIAPGAKILLVTAASGSTEDLFAAVHWALNQPGVTAVSMSWGGSGIGSTSSTDFRIAGNSGGPIPFASSGDAGYMSSPQYPAVDTYVTGVGGTRVNAVQPTSSLSDWGWEYSGGGSSSDWAAPTLALLPVPQFVPFAQRAVPDVAAVADSQHSAVSVYYADQWLLNGGTSTAAPIWAGVAALLGESVGAKNQSLLTKLGNPGVGFNKILYQMAMSSKDATLFNRPTSGSNNFIGANCPLCTATGIYNEVTGLGSPNVANMVAYLGGTAPATAAVAAIEPSRLGQPIFKMTRRMLQKQIQPQQPATQSNVQMAAPD